MSTSASLSRRLPVDPDTAFRVITDVSGLPVWNESITQVIEVPEKLYPGVEWVVEMSALGQRWHSRSRLTSYDPQLRLFAHRSCSDDGNPSYAEWTWQVVRAPGGCEVTVSWTLNPRTFWRRLLLGRVRARQLHHSEVPASLDALDVIVRVTRAGA